MLYDSEVDDNKVWLELLDEDDNVMNRELVDRELVDEIYDKAEDVGKPVGVFLCFLISDALDYIQTSTKSDGECEEGT